MVEKNASESKSKNKENIYRKGRDTTESFYITSYLFGRILGILYLITFISTWVQIHGLIGSMGISPIGDHFVRILATKHINFFNFPTIFWFDQSDYLLDVSCGLGTLASIGLFLDILPGIFYNFFTTN